MINSSFFLKSSQFQVLKYQQNRLNKHINRGFTIVELLIVIVVIGILAGLVIIAYNGIIQRAHTSTLLGDLSQNHNALGIYQATNGTFPSNQPAAGLKSSSGDTLTYNVSADGNSYCLQATGFNSMYAITSNSNPVQGYCSGTTLVPGTSSPPIPTIIGTSAHDAAGYTVSVAPFITTPSSTQIGDLTVIVGYVEANNQAKAGATFGSFALPTGVTLASGFPIETDPATITSTNDHRMYVWYYYATVAGATTLTFTNDHQIYWGLASVTVRGGPTSGNPFADAPSTGITGTNAAGVTSTPPVSLTLGGANSLVLWAYTDWNGPNPGYPSGITDLSHASNWPGQPAIGYTTYTAAGSTGTISATRSGNEQGMITALLSLRGN
jgi:prepilin-type N-terminal cleavage/methylation domain-containing protein